MKREDLIEKMRTALGLTRYEALLYLSLLQGASSPREASIKSGVPLPRIYDVIRTLEAKGFVAKEPGGWYRAMPPRAIVASTLARIEEEARRKARRASEILEEIERMKKSERTARKPYFIEGFYPIVSAAVEIVSRSGKAYILIDEGFHEASTMIQSLVSSLSDAIPRMTLRILAPNKWVLGEDTVELVEELGGEIAYTSCLPISMVAGDAGFLAILRGAGELVGFLNPDVEHGLLDRMDIIWQRCPSRIDDLEAGIR